MLKLRTRMGVVLDQPHTLNVFHRGAETPGIHWTRGFCGPQYRSGRYGDQKNLVANPLPSHYTD